jgi:hypothetical protein
MVKVLRKKDGHINEVPEHVANNKKAMDAYGYIKLDQQVKKPTFEPKTEIVLPNEQEPLTVMELKNETVETQTEPKKRGRKSKN